MTIRARPLAFLGFALMLFAVNPGCLCVEAHEKEPEKEQSPQDKLKDCLSECDDARWSCQVHCSRDETCSRACVAAYDKCIDICNDRRR